MSRQVIREAYPLESFSELRQHADEYAGETVILGGEIIETRNEANATTVLILERPLGYDRRPYTQKASGGRFMIRFNEYLEPMVFEPGRRVTVAGRVRGTEIEQIGEAPYQYVFLEGREVRVWKDYETYDYYPYYPYYPAYDFYIYRRRFRRHKHW
jgi:outer membrane lipoprotein